MAARTRSGERRRSVSVLPLLLVLGAPCGLQAQVGTEAAAREIYVEAVAAHFGVSSGEVLILAEGPILLDEVAVVLRIAQLSGISSSAILALRRSREGWLAISRRYEVGAGSFYESIPEGQVDDRMRRVWELFRDHPSTGWDGLQLSDDEVVALVNLRVLTRELGISHGRVLGARGQADSFSSSVRHLMGPGR